MRIRFALRVAEQRGSTAIRHGDSHSKFEIAQRGGRIDGVVRVIGENDAEGAVNLTSLIRLAPRGRQARAVDTRPKGGQLRGSGMGDHNSPYDPSKRLEGEVHDFARGMAHDLAQAKGRRKAVTIITQHCVRLLTHSRRRSGPAQTIPRIQLRRHRPEHHDRTPPAARNPRQAQETQPQRPRSLSSPSTICLRSDPNLRSLAPCGRTTRVTS